MRACKFCGEQTDGEFHVEEISTFIALCDKGDCAEKAEAWREEKLEALEE